MAIKRSKFRGSNNRRIAKQLFWDHSRMMAEGDRVVDFKPFFTLHHDVDGYINFRKEYLKDEDPTGYKTANRLLEDYDHWMFLMKNPWFREAKAQWDVELEAKLKSKALSIFETLALDSDLKPAERISAAKAMLALATQKPASKRLAGAPTREEVDGELKRQAGAEKELQEDLARIGIVK